jgi:BlaI family transcriptional regulator, penicillinase repressor
MARPPTKILTDAELRIMQVLWKRGEATITDICNDLRPKAVRATVQTMLRILERKRYVRHRLDGRTFVYCALVGRNAAIGRAVQKLSSSFFARSSGALVLHLLDQHDLDPETRSRAKRLLEERDR